MAEPVLNREAWSLRRQFVVPLAITILVVAILVTLIALWSAQSAYQQMVFERMDGVSHQIRTSTYPFTKNVLQQIKSYSGVDVVLLTHDRAVAMHSLLDSEQDWLHGFVLRGFRERARVTSSNRDLDYAYFPFIDEPMSTEFSGMLLMIEDNHRSGIWQSSVWAPAVSGLVSALAIVLVTTVIATRIVRRIERLEGQVNRIAGGQYEVIAPSGPSDSIHRLSRSINSLSKQLEIAHDWIAKTERSRLISMIAGGMAHQLRNSLTGASLLLQSFIHDRQCKVPEEIVMAQNQLKLAAESVRRLLASDPSVELVDEPDLSVEAIFQSVADCVASYAEHQGVAVRWDIDATERETMIPQGAAVVGALVNLTMNAVEAAGQGGTVACELVKDRERLEDQEVSPDAKGHMLRWRIIDDGPGPPADVAPSIMEPFVSSKREGVGLGLPMAARVAQRCHGSLSWRREGDRTLFELVVRGIN